MFWSKIHTDFPLLSYSTLKIWNQQMLFTFKTGQSFAGKINIWRINECNQITSFWVHFCHILSLSCSAWLFRAVDKHGSMLLSQAISIHFLPCSQILKLSRRTQICFFLAWMQPHRDCPGVTYGGRYWPRELQQRNAYPFIPPPNTSDISVFTALEVMQQETDCRALLYSWNIHFSPKGKVYVLLIFTHVKEIWFCIF